MINALVEIGKRYLDLFFTIPVLLVYGATLAGCKYALDIFTALKIKIIYACKIIYMYLRIVCKIICLSMKNIISDFQK